MIRAVLVFSALCAIACGPPARDAVDPSGYRHPNYALAVSAKSGRLMPGGWILDNYYDAGSTSVVLKRKASGNYLVDYWLDVDGDGTYENIGKKEFAYELRFTHRRHDGRVFLRTIPLSPQYAEKKLNVLLNRYVEQVAGTGYEVVVFGKNEYVQEKRYGVAVKDVQDSKLGRTKAIVAKLEVANLDQIEIDPKARKDQVVLVVAHTNFAYTSKGRRGQLPVLLIAGYANQPEDFQNGLPDFWDFLNRIEISGNKGFAVPQAREDANSVTRAAPPTSSGVKPQLPAVEQTNPKGEGAAVEQTSPKGEGPAVSQANAEGKATPDGTAKEPEKANSPAGAPPASAPPSRAVTSPSTASPRSAAPLPAVTPPNAPAPKATTP